MKKLQSFTEILKHHNLTLVDFNKSCTGLSAKEVEAKKTALVIQAFNEGNPVSVDITETKI